MNGCAHHTVGHIGILGVDKKGKSGTRSPWAAHPVRTLLSASVSALR